MHYVYRYFHMLNTTASRGMAIGSFRREPMSTAMARLFSRDFPKRSASFRVRAPSHRVRAGAPRGYSLPVLAHDLDMVKVNHAGHEISMTKAAPSPSVGQMLTGPLFNEPMRVETVQANGPGTGWSHRAFFNSGLRRKRLSATLDLATKLALRGESGVFPNILCVACFFGRGT